MDYDTAVGVFFAGADGDRTAVPAPASASPARRLRDAAEPLAMHPVWSRQTNEALAKLGLDFLTGYVGGRAAALGEPAPAVVVAVFAVFEPGMLTAAYEAARAACPRERLVAVRAQATTESLRAVVGDDGDDGDVGRVVDVLRRAADAAPAAGRPLFAGLRDQPWPADPVGGLWRGCELLREHRGDSHVAASVAAGLDPVEMNVLTECWLGMDVGAYSATRGWDAEAIGGAVDRLQGRGWLAGGQLTDAGTAARAGVEDATDRGVTSVVEAIGADLDGVIERLDGWSAACIAAAAFPPDPFKRAAG